MSESYQIKGTVHEIGEIQTFPSGFTKRVLVIITDPGEYPQYVPVEFVKDKCGLLDSLAVGQEVTVAINIRGNEYNGKYYVNLQGWRLEKGESQSSDDDDIPWG